MNPLDWAALVVADVLVCVVVDVFLGGSARRLGERCGCAVARWLVRRRF
jgi:hypothetical protein